MSNYSQALRVETPEHACLLTSRTTHSALWFVNNKALELYILGYLAKYQNKYNVILHSFCIQGSHVHLVARFPEANRAAFMRDFSARIAEGVKRHVSRFPGGHLFEKRYSNQLLPLKEDIEHYVFYSALQAVNDGLAERISDYPSYNSIFDAVSEKNRSYKVVRYGEYNAKKRYNRKVALEDFTDSYKLTYSRVPGYEGLSLKDYSKLMIQKLELQRLAKVSEWLEKGHRFMTKEELRKVIPGSLPRERKEGGAAPVVLTCCREARAEILDWYFGIVSWYREASRRLRAGLASIQFPPFTYPPPTGLYQPG